MTTREQVEITGKAREKMLAAIALVQASIRKLHPYDERHLYSPDEAEPYDALSDRFLRAVELCLKFFRAYERLQFAEESETLRDQLNRMEKLGLVSSVELWFQMRDVRNRIVHDYLPQDIKQLYDDMMGTLGTELSACADAVRQLVFHSP
ncbi:MAG: nucleotidyltransferase substrate binding protein [Lentisphaeria bacterium]|jgi:hypothetical protein